MRKIKLTKGKFAIVDDEDFDRINRHKWCASLDSRGTKWYAKRRKKKGDNSERWTATKIRMHHEVLDVALCELPEGHVVDHVNHNGLDCRKFIEGNAQLEIITQSENMLRSMNWKRKKVEPWL